MRHFNQSSRTITILYDRVIHTHDIADHRFKGAALKESLDLDLLLWFWLCGEVQPAVRSQSPTGQLTCSHPLKQLEHGQVLRG